MFTRRTDSERRLGKKRIMSKNLLQIFNRYTPNDRSAEILLSADAEGIRLRADKEQRLIEAEAPFPDIVPRRTLYEIE